jgi:predicted phage-related endonuclease
MLGLSPNVSRTELLHMKHTCTPKEFSDWVQINILDYGHEVEAMARPIGEQVIGTELYPVTCVDDDDRLIASCDGLTMAEDEGWEHKQWNEELASAVAAGTVPDTHMPQVQQQLMITGASRWLFMVSDGTPEKCVYTWVLPDLAWFERIRAGWDQFDADLAIYEPKNFAPKPVADVIKALPALAVQIKGEVTFSNLPIVKAKADQFIANIKTDLQNDDDFANAEATVKFCGEAETNLELAKQAAIAQTASIDDVMRTIDYIRDQLREKRLMLEKLVKTRKDQIKEQILVGVKKKFVDHVATLEAEIVPIRLVYQACDFAGAMKNKRTLATLHNAVDTELANAKIAVDAIAKAVRGRLTWYRANVGDYEALFADLQAAIQKPDEDFQLLVNTRIADHKAKETARQAAAVAAAQAAPAPTEVPRTTLAPAAAWPFPVPQVGAALTPVTPPSLRIGQIADRLGFPLTAEFLKGLGFEPAGKDRAAVLYHESDFPNICRRLIEHISQVQMQPQAA